MGLLNGSVCQPGGINWLVQGHMVRGSRVFEFCVGFSWFLKKSVCKRVLSPTPGKTLFKQNLIQRHE